MPWVSYLPDILDLILSLDGTPLETLVLLGDRVTQWPLLMGNDFEILDGGDQAYPAMIEAIDVGRAVDRPGHLHLRQRPDRSALRRCPGPRGRPRRRGSRLDRRRRCPALLAVGDAFLEKEGGDHRRVLPDARPGLDALLNLRNHRKILVIDGTIGFTGGMNILEEYHRSMQPRDLEAATCTSGSRAWSSPTYSRCSRMIDLLLWGSARGRRPVPTLEAAEEVLARGVIDGPDDDRDNLLNVILGGLARAKSTVAIATPYFLPDARLISALEVAALRGVQVDILLPSARTTTNSSSGPPRAQAAPLVEVGRRV